MSKKSNNIKGSTTVEAALIFPIIFIALILIFYMGILQFQNISSIAASMDAANYISSNWRYLDSQSEKPKNAEDIINSEYYKNKHIWDVYGDAIERVFESKSKIGVANEVAAEKIGVVPSYFEKGKQSNTDMVHVNNGFLVNTVEVSVDKTYFNPLMRFTRIGQITTKEEYNFNAKAVSTITNPTEFIRNLDFILYIVDEFK